MTEKTAIFIDGANCYAAGRALGMDIDYKKILDWVKKDSRLIRAYYYTLLSDEDEYSSIRPLVDWLGYNGYMVVTKPLRETEDANGQKRFKLGISTDLIVDMMEIAPYVDKIILFSGDGQYTKLVSAVQRGGVRVIVASTLKSASPVISDDLRWQADEFIDLEDLRNFITREKLKIVGKAQYDADAR